MSLKDLLKYPFTKRRWKSGVAKESDCKPITAEMLNNAKIGSPSNEHFELVSYAEFEKRLKALESKEGIK